MLVVAGADVAGDLLGSSAPGDVRALGTDVVGPWVNADPGGGVLCDGEIAAYSGTAVAAAKVSGLAALMMNLSDATPDQVRSIIASTGAASQSGLVDAYDAVLRLDSVENDAIREALLDVAGFESDESDGDFDEFDLPTLASLSPSGGAPRGGGGGGGGDALPYLRRMDLNGDGIVGGTGAARFDLNGDGAYGQVSSSGPAESLDETAVTDLDVVCYYAYSDLYDGDTDVRDGLLLPGHSDLYVEIVDFPERIAAGEPGSSS